MKYAYARVSTQRQFLDGNSIEDQIAQLKIASYDELVVEKFTGSTTKRPRLDELIQRLECGNRIIEHTQAGKKIARSKDGFRKGCPPIDQKRKDFAVDLILNQHKTYREIVELTGLFKSTLIRAVNDHKTNVAFGKARIRCL